MLYEITFYFLTYLLTIPCHKISGTPTDKLV